MRRVNPTRQFYEHVSAIALHFNRGLFDNSLPTPLFTLKRGIGALGHFSPNRWISQGGQVVGEISLNPALFGQHSWLQLMQTIAQQQCHLWQHVHGEPSRPGYHNAEWAAKMKQIGLVPSSTGVPGGRTTGQSMSAYPEPGGKFINACVELANGPLCAPLAARWKTEAAPAAPPLPLKLPRTTLRRLMTAIGEWSDDPGLIASDALKEQKRKLKYTCPRCDVNVWGRPGLGILCRSCQVSLREVPAGAKRLASNARHL
jgi:hypothetical protein